MRDYIAEESAAGYDTIIFRIQGQSGSSDTCNILFNDAIRQLPEYLTESLGIILYKNLQRIQSVLLGFVRMQTIYYTGDIQHLRIVDRALNNNAILFLRIKLIAGIVNTLGFSSQRAKH